MVRGNDPAMVLPHRVAAARAGSRTGDQGPNRGQGDPGHEPRPERCSSPSRLPPRRSDPAALQRQVRVVLGTAVILRSERQGRDLGLSPTGIRAAQTLGDGLDRIAHRPWATQHRNRELDRGLARALARRSTWEPPKNQSTRFAILRICGVFCPTPWSDSRPVCGPTRHSDRRIRCRCGAPP